MSMTTSSSSGSRRSIVAGASGEVGLAAAQARAERTGGRTASLAGVVTVDIRTPYITAMTIVTATADAARRSRVHLSNETTGHTIDPAPGGARRDRRSPAGRLVVCARRQTHRRAFPDESRNDSGARGTE